jgi:hypothetical protein
MLSDDLSQRAQVIGPHLVIGVEEQNILAARFTDPFVARRTSFSVDLFEVSDLLDFSEGFDHHSLGVVSTPVIDNNDFEIRVILFKD